MGANMKQIERFLDRWPAVETIYLTIRPRTTKGFASGPDR
jgi:hypothetical protein